MPSDDIPDDLRNFIVTHINTIAHLEALLLLRGHRQEDWTSKACAQRLYIPEGHAAQVLHALNESGFLAVSEGRYRFHCRNEELEQIVLRFADLHRQKLIAVTNLIHTNQNRIRQFADAFKLRGET